MRRLSLLLVFLSAIVVLAAPAQVIAHHGDTDQMAGQTSLDPGGMDEQTVKKLAQNLSMLGVATNLVLEQLEVQKFIIALEQIAGDEVTAYPNLSAEDRKYIKEHAAGWLAVLNEYDAALDRLGEAAERFLGREDMISDAEIEREFLRCYPKDLREKVNRVTAEIFRWAFKTKAK